MVIREELPLPPLVSLAGWVASRVITLPPARACLQLAPQPHASHTSKLLKPTSSQGQVESSVKLTSPRTLHWTLCPLGRWLFAGEKLRRVPAGTRQQEKQEKALSVNSKQFGIHYSSSQTSKIWGGNSLDFTIYFSRPIVIAILMTEKL